jgi:regulator of protease activity HflC (stomatin/prohibitin superfamily)
MLGLVKVVGEQEWGVMFRLGRLLDKPLGPGRVWTIPGVDRLVVVDMRATTIDVPPVEVTTKDGVPLSVSAYVNAQVVVPTDAVVRVVDYTEATSQLAQTALRAVFKTHAQDEALFERPKIEALLRETIDDAAATWGVKVSAVDLEVADAPAARESADQAR